jgi:hypothetical protein
LFILFLNSKDGHCVWYGECGTNPLGKTTNCYYNGTAKLLTDDLALQTFETACGMLYNGKFSSLEIHRLENNTHYHVFDRSSRLRKLVL